MGSLTGLPQKNFCITYPGSRVFRPTLFPRRLTCPEEKKTKSNTVLESTRRKSLYPSRTAVHRCSDGQGEGVVLTFAQRGAFLRAAKMQVRITSALQCASVNPLQICASKQVKSTAVQIRNIKYKGSAKIELRCSAGSLSSTVQWFRGHHCSVVPRTTLTSQKKCMERIYH